MVVSPPDVCIYAKICVGMSIMSVYAYVTRSIWLLMSAISLAIVLVYIAYVPIPARMIIHTHTSTMSTMRAHVEFAPAPYPQEPSPVSRLHEDAALPGLAMMLRRQY